MKNQIASTAAFLLGTLSLGSIGGAAAFSANDLPMKPKPSKNSSCGKTPTASLFGISLGSSPCDAGTDACELGCTGNPMGPGSLKVIANGKKDCTDESDPICVDFYCTRKFYFDASCSNFRTQNTIIKKGCN